MGLSSLPPSLFELEGERGRKKGPCTSAAPAAPPKLKLPPLTTVAIQFAMGSIHDVPRPSPVNADSHLMGLDARDVKGYEVLKGQKKC